MKNNRYDDKFYKWLEENYVDSIDVVKQKIYDKFGYIMNERKMHNVVDWGRKKGYKIKRINYRKKKYNEGDMIIHNHMKRIFHDGKFIPYTHYIWIINGNELPKNPVCVYLDGNNKNYDITNIYFINRRQSAYIRTNRYKFTNKEELKTLCLLADLSHIKPHYRRKEKNANKK